MGIASLNPSYALLKSLQPMREVRAPKTS